MSALENYKVLRPALWSAAVLLPLFFPAQPQKCHDNGWKPGRFPIASQSPN